LQAISAARTNRDFESSNPKKYVRDLNGTGWERPPKTDSRQAIIFKLDLVVTYIKLNIRVPPLQFVFPPADLNKMVLDLKAYNIAIVGAMIGANIGPKYADPSMT
jgi:hypothetical protein